MFPLDAGNEVTQLWIFRQYPIPDSKVGLNKVADQIASDWDGKSCWHRPGPIAIAAALLPLRVWALRKSRLPIRILKWHKKNSRYVELIFTYSKEQPPEFFDPDTFAAVLDDPSVSSHRLMNFLLRDPGGQSFPTPGS